MLRTDCQLGPVAGLAGALAACTSGGGELRETEQALGSGSGAPRVFQCSFNAGPPATVPYQSRLSAVFVDTPASVNGLWQGVIGGGLWHVGCENTDCQAAADYPEGATKPIAGTGAVIGGDAFEELSWDVCPPDAMVAPGKTWFSPRPARHIDADTVSWEGRRSYSISDVTAGGVMTVHTVHDTRVAYAFGTPTSLTTDPWFTDAVFDATVEVCGSTPVVDRLTVSYVGPYTSGSLVVSRRDAGGCGAPGPGPGSGSDVPPGPGSGSGVPGPGSGSDVPGPGSGSDVPGPGSGSSIPLPSPTTIPL